MAFDQGTRNRLQRLVSDCRKRLTEEFTLQLQQDYGLDPRTGEVTELSRLTHLTDRERHTAALLRETLAHYLAGEGESRAQRQAAIDRIIREQAFTVLNRLAALLMMEARGLLRESVSKGSQSQAFELYRHLAGTALGETGEAYQTFLFSLFDEFAIDLPALFDRFAPQGRLFPRETALNALVELLNDHEIEPLWALDETIGWIYQYFNSQEERKAMRKASQAPRNSRELAVRNQFFTPRYVVEFLVDNTLGRQWFNATGGTTPLRDSCQYLLVKPDEQPEAGIKLRDPRTLKLLDPACGSMHFGLYAFDLFLQIYRDAWQWEQQHGPGSLDVSTQPEAGLEPLCHTYADEEALLRDVPRLIIEHNIYGVDIDPRAAQIASLALWLRAQRAWHEAGVQAMERPDVGQGNVIAAVAPPAEKELREAFKARLDRQDAELFEKTLQMLKGLPELGVLLRAEKELPALIREVYVGKGSDLFAEQEQETWQKAEERLRQALLEFSEEAGATYQSRLFAQDALQGLRMIDLCRVIFDVVVMNPPFGLPTLMRASYLRDHYDGGHNDIYASFVIRALELSQGGCVGAITSSSFLLSPRQEKFRKDYFIENAFCLADMGLGVMDDAMVRSAIYVLDGSGGESFYGANLLGSAKWCGGFDPCLVKSKFNLVDREGVFSIPKAKLLISAPDHVREILSNGPYMEPDYGTAREGMKTFDNERFIRLYWEVPEGGVSEKVGWRWLVKGGEFSFFYSDVHLVLNWKKDGAELKDVNFQLNGSTSQVRQASKYWGLRGATYSKRSSGFSARLMPPGCIFTSNGPAVIPLGEVQPEYLLGWLNSSFVRALIQLNSGAFDSYSTGSIKKLPWVEPSGIQSGSVVKNTVLAAEASVRTKCFTNEISRWFCGVPIKSDFLGTVDFINNVVSESCRVVNDCLKEIDKSILEIYSVDDASWIDGVLVSEGVSEDDAESETRQGWVVPDLLEEREVAHKIISFLAGRCFGRWGDSYPEELVPSGEEVFLQPSIRPPASESLPGSAGGSVFTAEQLSYGIIDSLEGFVHDCHTFEAALCGALGYDGICQYLLSPSGFFASHLSDYTLSKRAAPIYLPVSSEKGGFVAFISYENLGMESLFWLVNELIEPKLVQVNNEVEGLRLSGKKRSRADEKRMEELSDFRNELADLRDTLLRIAPDYKPNHDDGVQITAAPLWPLFRHKPWKKVLKETWEKLEQGDYDWAHLAMAYWPERVREKCVTDKSLAIAHDLEHLYVEPEPAPKKTRGRKKSTGSSE